MAGRPPSRRAFLGTLSLALLGAAGAWRFLTPARLSAPPRLAVPLADVPADGALVLPDAGVAVVRGAGEQVEVLTLSCTHLGCRLLATEDGFACPCHGSAFDPHGRVLAGPARRPLAHLPFERDHGVLRIRT